MQENLPVERLVRKALRAGETIGRPGIRQLGIPQGAKRLEECRFSAGAAFCAPLQKLGWAVPSSIIIHGSFDHPLGVLSALDNALNMFYRFRSKEVFSCLSAYTRRYIFNNKKITVMFQCVGYFRFYHCLFHSKSPCISPSDPKIYPQIRIRLVEGDDLDKWPTRVAALYMQRPACFSVAKDETTWAIFVFRVVFNYFTFPGHCILQFRHTYVADNTLIDTMFGVFVMTPLNLCAYFQDQCHN
jgi:hypothetical protein